MADGSYVSPSSSLSFLITVTHVKTVCFWMIEPRALRAAFMNATKDRPRRLLNLKRLMHGLLVGLLSQAPEA